MNTLLAIVNNPAESKEFIEYTAKLAKDMFADIHLLYIEDPTDYPVVTPGTIGSVTAPPRSTFESKTKQATKYVSKYINQIKKKKPGETKIVFSAEIGETLNVLNRFINEDKASMLVLESEKGEPSWTQTSAKMDIIRNVNCPIWIIPHGAEYLPFGGIVYATDYKEEDISTLKKLIEHTHQFMPEITALHVTDNIDFKEKISRAGFNEQLQQEIAYDKINMISITDKEESNLGYLVNNYASLINAGLIVVLKENKGFLERIFQSSSTKDILKQSHYPVLVYHEKE